MELKNTPPALTQPVYNEIHDHDLQLRKAEAGVAKLASIRNNRWYPSFHIASPGGWINDPNGLCFYQGRWHVFYQLHPYGTQWGPMHWGHVSSTDLVTWQREKIFMAPSLEEEKDGVFSGSAVIDDDGKLRFYYTGHRWVNGKDNTEGEWQVQMCALAENSQVTQVKKLGMVVDCPRSEVDSHFRDPKVWKIDSTWYMAFGVSSAKKRGQIWLYTSPDLNVWRFDRILFEHPDPEVWMLECPDFFPLTNELDETKWVLGFSAMGSKPSGFINRNTYNAGYLIGTWQPGDSFQAETEFRQWDNGHNFYAPQSFTDPNGRQIMFGWMSPFAENNPSANDGWCGCLTLPREVRLQDSVLSTFPVTEVEGYRQETTRSEFNFVVGSDQPELIISQDDTIEIELQVDLTASTAERFGLKVHASEQGGYTYIAYDAQTETVILDRRDTDQGEHGYRATPLDVRECGQVLSLRVFVDKGCLEVYVNQGRHVLTSYSFPASGKHEVKLISESGDLQVENLRVYRLSNNGL